MGCPVLYVILRRPKSCRMQLHCGAQRDDGLYFQIEALQPQNRPLARWPETLQALSYRSDGFASQSSDFF